MNAIWKRKISFRVNDYWVKKDQSIKEIRLCGILSDDVSKTEVQSHIFFSFPRPLLLPCTSCNCWLPEQTCEFRFWSTGSMFTDDNNHFERWLNSNVSELSRVSLCKCSCSFFVVVRKLNVEMKVKQEISQSNNSHWVYISHYSSRNLGHLREGVRKGRKTEGTFGENTEYNKEQRQKYLNTWLFCL